MTNKAIEQTTVGGNVKAAHASLRIYHPDLDPDSITTHLKCAPSLSYRAGDRISPRVAASRKNGMWSIASDLSRDRPLAEHIRRVLSQVSSDLSKWAEVTRQYSADIYCAIDIVKDNSVASIPAEVVAAVGARGLAIELDFYISA